jgi:hypothetical protein
MDFRDMHGQMGRSKAKREFFSTHNVARATKSLKRDIDRLEASLNGNDVEGQIEALGDIIVHCLGGLETFGCNTELILRKATLDNKAGLRIIEDSNCGKTALR